MKRHSILTTLFPRMAFSRRSIPEIQQVTEGLGWEDSELPELKLRRLRPWIGVLADHDDQPLEVVVKNWLPEFKVDAGSGPKKIQCHLIYREVGDSFESLRLTGNPAMAHIFLGARDAAGAVIEMRPLENPEHGGRAGEPVPISDDEKFRRIWNLLQDERVSTVDLVLRIDVLSAEAVKSSEPNISVHQFAARRKEWVASEFTTGYRRVICHILQCLGSTANQWHHLKGSFLPLELSSDLPPPSILNTNQSDGLHSTPEDAWRLLCSFHSVEICAKAVNKQGHYVLGLQDFISGLTSEIGDKDGSTPSLILLNALYEEKAIARRVGLRKVLEYFIYEELPSLPR